MIEIIYLPNQTGLLSQTWLGLSPDGIFFYLQLELLPVSRQTEYNIHYFSAQIHVRVVIIYVPL